jgi:hypothetical protein
LQSRLSGRHSLLLWLGCAWHNEFLYVWNGYFNSLQVWSRHIFRKNFISSMAPHHYQEHARAMTSIRSWTIMAEVSFFRIEVFYTQNAFHD